MLSRPTARILCLLALALGQAGCAGLSGKIPKRQVHWPDDGWHDDYRKHDWGDDLGDCNDDDDDCADEGAYQGGTYR